MLSYDKRHCLVSLVLVAMLVAVFLAPALASELEQQQQSIQRQMEVQQNRAAEAQRTVTSVSEQLKAIQDELDSALTEYKNIQQQLAATEQQIAANTVILATAEQNLSARSKLLNKRIRDIYENGQVNYLDVLLGASDFGDFTTRMDLLKRVVNQDITLINKVRAERELVLAKRAELERDRAAIIELKQAAEEKQRVITARKQQREQVLAAAVSERDAAERAYQELQATSRQIEQMLRSNHSGGSSYAGGSGSMIWPVSGPITSPFGWRNHPIFGTARFHSGYDIGADYGEPVAAAADGVVVYSGWMGGYGKAVIIDHGGGISTLYGHNSELLVDEGQHVRKGQIISRVGSTGYSTGPHLHFEVRQDGAPVDPGGYLP